MSITSIYDKDNKDNKTVDFPWVGIAEDGDVVLFSCARQGTVLRTTDNGQYPVGYHCLTWDMRHFKPLAEGQKIVLQNNWERTNAES